jgi:predicted RNase H-like HicB family nuclease
MKAAKGHAVRYERDRAGWWVATVRGQSAQTQGRTIEQARERIREALAALLDVAPSAIVIGSEDVRLAPAERKALSQAHKAAAKAQTQAKQAERAMHSAVKSLVKSGLSLRDAGELLGVSRQRVHQILGAAKRAA